MTLPASFADPTFRIYLALAQYPVLQTRIRAKMRDELFARGVVNPTDFKLEVREQAIASQNREGLSDPFGEEPEDIWRERKDKVRDYLTDLYFANNLPFEHFETLVQTALDESGAETDKWLINLNVELAPQELLIEQAMRISRMLPEDRKHYEARLQEIKVVLIRGMISDQLGYIKIAKNWFTVADLMNIRQRKIGKGKIGGKAAGMLLAQRIIHEIGDDDIKKSVNIPDSYFLSADVMYAFMAHNDLMHWADQKYKTEEEIRDDYPVLQKEYLKGRFPEDILDELQNILHRIGDKPLIVRSSSLLEDNFGTSFAGKYDSWFCPNQGSPKENLTHFTNSIIKVYSSALNPDALLYRRKMDLQDYDERIAVLIQEVQGERLGDYFLPHAAGVAFSRNLYRWSPQIERDAGFLRLVWGLGTRAVDRVGIDHPRLVALSHPHLHSQSDPREIRGYAQQDVDLIDLKDNLFKSLPVHDVLDRHYPILRYLVQIYQDDFLAPLRANLIEDKISDLVITFDELLRRTPLADRMRRLLQLLEKNYNSPVDLEFTIAIKDPASLNPEIEITILQCRPQSQLQESIVSIPQNLLEEDIMFATSRVLPRGQVDDIRYVMFISPEAYFSLPSQATRMELSRSIGRLNSALEGEVFICVGPGRWGTKNPDLGIRVGYGDIYHSRALVELSGKGVGSAPEPSFGTHFFQDLIEAEIYPLAIYLDDKDAIFNRDFFYDSPNCLADFLPKESDLGEWLHLIRVEDFRPGATMSLVMDEEASRAVAYLVNEIEEEE